MASSFVDTEPQRVSLARLKSQVLDAGLCISCGACLGLCPHLIYADGQVAAPDDCGLEKGRCEAFCPQIEDNRGQAFREKLHKKTGNSFETPIGPVLEVFQARAADEEIRSSAQYGGAVSVLSALALDEDVVQQAVLTRADERNRPTGFRTGGSEGLVTARGSIYSAGAALSELNLALAENTGDKLAVVGLPCQIKAARAIQAQEKNPSAKERVALLIGLFCTWNLSVRSMRGIMAEAGIKGKIKKSDIPPPPAEVFEVKSDAGVTQIPLEELRGKTMPGCALCPDMTAELADISVGAAEGKPGWNTVIVRTEKGAELIDLAVRRGMLEKTGIKEESLDHLKQAAKGKRNRAFNQEVEAQND